MSRRVDELGIDNLKIVQDTDYFCFGMDSILLANFIKSTSSNNVIVDLCSGSGVIPIIVNAKQKCKSIYDVELQKEMFSLLDENISLNKLGNKIKILNEDIKNIDKIKNFILKNELNENVDIITWNY